MTDDGTQPAPRRRLGPVTALAAGSLAGLVLGLGGVASAQTETPAPSTSATPEAGTETDTGADGAARDPLCDEDEAPADSAA